MYKDITFSKEDVADSLTIGQLELLAHSNCDIFIACLRERPGYFDVERIRLILDLGIVEANRRLAESGE